MLYLPVKNRVVICDKIWSIGNFDDGRTEFGNLHSGRIRDEIREYILDFLVVRTRFLHSILEGLCFLDGVHKEGYQGGMWILRGSLE